MTKHDALRKQRIIDYIAATLRAILDGHPQSRIEDLMPWRFNQTSSLAA